MKVVICGDGKVGSTLSQQLSMEGHDVVIIDNNEKVVTQSMNTLDVMCIKGNAASRKVQLEAGVDHADLLIAATSGDELNLLCCLIAKKLGAKHTIARVRNPEYSDELRHIKDDLGLSMTINPELAAAREIARSLRFPSAIKVDSFAKGRVELVEFKILDNSPLLGRKLHELPKISRVRVLVCAIMRDGKAIIPDGNFTFEKGDKVTITAKPADIFDFFKAINIRQEPIKKVLIVGGGKIAYYLAQMLNDLNMQVKIIEIDEKQCNLLSELLPNAMIIHADATDQEILVEEGLLNADAYIALTGIDEENILLSLYALSKNVKKVITKVNRINFDDILANVGIESVISPKYITANQIVRYVRAMQNSLGSNVEALSRIVNNQVEALEFKVCDKFRYHDIPLKDLKFIPNLLIACLTRNGNMIFPDGNESIHIGDSVIVVTTQSGLNDLIDIIQNGKSYER